MAVWTCIIPITAHSIHNFHTCLLTLTQPPLDFQPPTFLGNPTNGWYHGQLREKQGVFSSQYVQFRYSRKLTDQFVCASDTVLLLSVNHAVLCNGNVHSLLQCCNNIVLSMISFWITVHEHKFLFLVGLPLLSLTKVYKNYSNLYNYLKCFPLPHYKLI